MATVTLGKVNLPFSGTTLLTFMMIHLFLFRFGETKPFMLCPPPYLMDLTTSLELRLNLFWVHDEGCKAVRVRDIYLMEFEVFQVLSWVMCIRHHLQLSHVPRPAKSCTQIHVGYVMFGFIPIVYACFRIYGHLVEMPLWKQGDVVPKDVNAVVAMLNTKRPIRCLDCRPSGFKCGINFQPPTLVPGGDLAKVVRVCCMVQSSTAVAELFSRIGHECDFVNSRRPFVHHHVDDSTEEGELSKTKLVLTVQGVNQEGMDDG
eukprot:TRINITY_DN5005_c0_g3_i1.p1 TRINITY_DN5005_c0_g3~~TRINITY_DN5005_c0_g3_i1.p1  ORF type:complete len:260 (+),score=34.48 TRINITY_DN5005_c0_g3_i1:152-931(+)